MFTKNNRNNRVWYKEKNFIKARKSKVMRIINPRLITPILILVAQVMNNIKDQTTVLATLALRMRVLKTDVMKTDG